MKRALALHERERRMLELLARGESGAEVARSMGYSFGSTRVYLHQLYRKIGVRDKAGAVVWYHDRLAVAQPGRAGAATAAHWPRREESVGDMALRTDLLTALGAMSLLLGAYGRQWEVAQRQRTGAAAPSADARRARSRAIWEAFLRGEGARAHSFGSGAALDEMLSKSPFDAVLVALLFVLDGEGPKAEAIAERLAIRRRARHTVSRTELDLVAAFKAAMLERDDEALGELHRIAGRSPMPAVLRHVSLAVLFHALRARRQAAMARDAANALWAEARLARHELEAIGEDPFRAVAARTRTPADAARPVARAAEGHAVEP